MSKSECLIKILLKNKEAVLVLQETHFKDMGSSAKGNIPGYKLVKAVGHRVYGIATYVKQNIDDISVIQKSCDNEIFILAVQMSGNTIVNVYKPPNPQWSDTVLPVFEHPVLYVGDFNSHHNQWNYSSDDQNGTSLVNWAKNNNLFLVFNAKDASTFIQLVGVVFSIQTCALVLVKEFQTHANKEEGSIW